MAEGARLESVYTARYPGFESLSLRHTYRFNTRIQRKPVRPKGFWRLGPVAVVPLNSLSLHCENSGAAGMAHALYNPPYNSSR